MGRILYDISQDYMGVIQKSRLFSGIEPDEANGMSKCLEITFREYDKEEVIFNEGDKITKIGMVIQGNVSIEQADYWGNMCQRVKYSERRMRAVTIRHPM